MWRVHFGASGERVEIAWHQVYSLRTKRSLAKLFILLDFFTTSESSMNNEFPDIVRIYLCQVVESNDAQKDLRTLEDIVCSCDIQSNHGPVFNITQAFKLQFVYGVLR